MSRRDFFRFAGAGMAVLATTAGARSITATDPQSKPAESHDSHASHGGMGTVGQVDHEANGFDPHDILYDFDYGEVSQENGRTVREWEILAIDKEIEIAPGIYFPAWVYGSATSVESRKSGFIVGRVPGPTLRCVEGERLRVHFTNAGTHPHTIHFHGIHHARMDGVPGVGAGIIHPGESTVYEFDARPFGCHLYHCHALPLKRHVHKGLYGGFIVDPDPQNYEGRERELAKSRNHQYDENRSVNEMIMVMNGFDSNFDGGNEVYAANSIAFAYMDKPIKISASQLQRLYLINMTEFDPINSLHLHANFFDYYDHGTTLDPTHKTIDTIMQCQAQRGILEFSFEGFEAGRYMFHAHQSEFAELGWMSLFELE